MSSAPDKAPFGPWWSRTDEEQWRQLAERREQAKVSGLRKPLLRLVGEINIRSLTTSGLTDWLIVNCHEVTKALLPWCARSRQEDLDKETPR